MLFRMYVSSEATRRYGSGRWRGMEGSWWIGKGSGRDLAWGSTCCANTLNFRRPHRVAEIVVRVIEWNIESTAGRIVRIN